MNNAIHEIKLRIMEYQTQINTWLNIMQEDSNFAVPEFMLEQMWNRMDYLISALTAYEEASIRSESSRGELSKDESSTSSS